MKSRNKAFTLIELLVVIAIIGILAGVVIASLNSARAKARDAKRISDLRQVGVALEMYYADNGVYPAGNHTTSCPFAAPLNTLITSGYIAALPTDPSNTGTSPFCYNYSSVPAGQLSSWSCGGVHRGSYAWAIVFSLENNNSDIKQATGTASDGFTHCITGALR